LGKCVTLRNGRSASLAAFSAAPVYSDHSARPLPIDRSALMAQVPGPGRPLVVALSLALVAALTVARADQPKSPSADEVRKLQDAYRAERRQANETGAARTFSPQALQREEDFARQAEASLTAGLLDEAAQAYREARWLLPSLPPDFPG